MPNKCSLVNCHSGYKPIIGEKIEDLHKPVFHFPNKADDSELHYDEIPRSNSAIGKIGFLVKMMVFALNISSWNSYFRGKLGQNRPACIV